MAGVTREAVIKAIAQRKKATAESFEVPEWGLTVYVRQMSAGDLRDAGFFDITEDAPPSMVADILPRVLVACLCDEEGNRLFSDEDATIFAQADFTVAVRVFNQAQRVNGLLDQEAQAGVLGGAQTGSGSSS